MVETADGTRITHGHIWSAIERTYKKTPIDLITVTKTLISDYGFYIPIITALCDMTEKVGSTANIQTHSLLLVELTMRELAIKMIDDWISEPDGQRFDDLTGLIREIADKNADIFRAIETGISFLSAHGYEDESIELRELLGSIADKIRRVQQQQFASHIINQYNALNSTHND